MGITIQERERKYPLTQLLDTAFAQVRDSTSAEAVVQRTAIQRIAGCAWRRRIIRFDDQGQRSTRARLTQRSFQALLEREQLRGKHRVRAKGEVPLHELVGCIAARLARHGSPQARVLREALDVLIERYIKTYRLWATGGRLASDDGFSARAFRVILWEERRKLLREHASEAEYEERLMYHTNLMRRQQLDAHQRIELAEALAEARKRVTGKHNLSSWYALHYKAEGYRSREIAKVFGLSDAAVRKRISQSRLTLGASNDDVPSHTVAA